MENPFLDNNRPVNGGLNRTCLVPLPGRDLPPALLGRRGYELLGAAPLQALIRRRLPALRGDEDPLRGFNQRLGVADVASHVDALAVAGEIGTRLGWLLLALQAAAGGPRAERDDWDRDHWAFWEQVRCVRLGGGMATGRLGEIIAATATDLLWQSGLTDYQVMAMPDADQLPLLGSARLLPAAPGQTLVFDCGQTRVKAALVTIGAGAVTALQLITAEPGPCIDLWLAEQGPAEAQQMWDRLLAQLVALLTDHAPGAGALAIVVALACRIHQGHPLPREWMSCYGRLQLICRHLETDLAAALTNGCGRPVTLRLVQDATAAALPYAGSENSVVLTLGTAIGTGYVPANDAGLLPLRLTR